MKVDQAIKKISLQKQSEPTVLDDKAMRTDRSAPEETTEASHLSSLGPPLVGWPPPVGRLHGCLAGDVVRVIEPHSETDPVAILLQFLVAVGNVVGRSPHFRVEATKHYLNLFVALVGETSKARKGTSWGHIDRLFTMAEVQQGLNPHDPWKKRIISGLSSGEGLIFEVRDVKALEGEVDSGVLDKRRIVMDGEFASTLKMLGRSGNTLSPVIRNAWDTGELRILTKNSPVEATGAHISIIGHITREELRRELTTTEMGNGFANRFLWACVRRSKLLPEGGNLRDEELRPIIEEIQDVIGEAQNISEITRDKEATQLWRSVYAQISEGKPGMVGAVTARAEAQAMRLACLFALLDRSSLVKVEHLTAALSVWDYCEASARFIFGQSTGDSVADRILNRLRLAGGDGLTRTEIRDLFQRNETKGSIDRGLALLTEGGLAKSMRAGEGGRETERWFVA